MGLYLTLHMCVYPKLNNSSVSFLNCFCVFLFAGSDVSVCFWSILFRDRPLSFEVVVDIEDSSLDLTGTSCRVHDERKGRHSSAKSFFPSHLVNHCQKRVFDSYQLSYLVQTLLTCSGFIIRSFFLAGFEQESELSTFSKVYLSSGEF